MNKPLMIIPPAQAEALYDDALRNDAIRVQLKLAPNKVSRDESQAWDDEDANPDRQMPSLTFVRSSFH